MEKFSLAADGVAAILRSDLEQTRGTEVYRVLDLFSDMSRHLKAGQIVEVTDHTGQKTTGKVAEVSPTSLVILTRERVRDSAGTEHDAWTGKQTHVPSAVRRVRRPGPVWDGALKGFGIALVVPLIVSASGVDTGADAFLTFGAMGAGIGLGIDALVGPATVYELSQPVRSVVFRPLFGKSRGGVMAVLRF